MRNERPSKKELPGVWWRLVLVFLLMIHGVVCSRGQESAWHPYSSADGSIPLIHTGKQQTASVLIDVNGDGVREFVIAERTKAPSVVLYRYEQGNWQPSVIDDRSLHIEAGGAAWDIDGDGDEDLILGGDWQSNEIWWWENPGPDFHSGVPWTCRLIKRGGAPKHHDLLMGDFDGDGKGELVFWNQEDQALCLAEIPEDPRSSATWEHYPIYRYQSDGQMWQRGNEFEPTFKKVNEHEGLYRCDINLDGTDDIVGGGYWFQHQEGKVYLQHVIDESYVFSRAAAGQLVEGGRPEVVFVTGEGIAPLVMYEWKKGTWNGKILVEGIRNGHSLEILDVNGDGYLDIFNAEMRLDGASPDATMRILFGDGTGHFKDSVIATGFGNHESRITDLDGDGDIDILGKPYNWETPRIDIWINKKH